MYDAQKAMKIGGYEKSDKVANTFHMKFNISRSTFLSPHGPINKNNTKKNDIMPQFSYAEINTRII